MQFVWGGRGAKFVFVTRQTHEASGETYYFSQFKRDYDVRSFPSDTERYQAQLLAVEALIIYGDIYNGENKPDGYFRVDFGGKTFRKRDFGMA